MGETPSDHLIMPMSTSYHQTIVVELGSSRIKVGFAGESKPRRVFNDVHRRWLVGRPHQRRDGSTHVYLGQILSIFTI
jgi:hypothetical protein